MLCLDKILDPKYAFMAWLIKAGHLNFPGLSLPLSCLGEMCFFLIWFLFLLSITKLPLTLVFSDFIMFPYRCLGEAVIWQDIFASLPCLIACQSVQKQ